MPVCFQLTKVGNSEPTPFQDIDNEICQNLGLEWDNDKYTHHWYDSIGLRLAIGQSWDEIVDEYKSRGGDCPWVLVSIVAYLREHYLVENWREIGWSR
jgi:hypothetical protein